MGKNPLITLESLGQSIWLDYIRRHLIASGDLQRLIDEDGITGVTSNPAIFEKAIAGSHDYDQMIAQMQGESPQAIYNAMSVEDIQQAAEHFRPIYDRTQGRDGFVSLEVSPTLARDTEGTIQEARRLWQQVHRPNILIKVPGTQEGLPAIHQLLSEGINVNITLLFSLTRYQDIAEAYISALEARVAKGEAIHHIASVASFFLSRIDVLVDPVLERKMMDPSPEIAQAAQSAHGQVAIACARKAYCLYESIYKSPRFQKLAVQGAQPQRLLWASTSTKNPIYSDVKYVDALIGPETVNTVPPETLDAYRDHGYPSLTLKGHEAETDQILNSLPQLGIELSSITAQLESEGIEKFRKPFEKLLAAIADKSASSPKERSLDPQQLILGDYEESVMQQFDIMQDIHFARRFYQKDASLWKSDPAAQESIRNGLGWLNVAQSMEAHVDEIQQFVQQIKVEGFTHVVHMGMGGSSLAPLVFQQSFSATPGFLKLLVLDTNDPEAISQIEQAISIDKTLFIVASKSGTTAEPIAFNDYFYERVKAKKGEQAGENFIAITDPETALVSVATERKFRKIFLNYQDIGGRYSALSYFGVFPAALMGINIEEVLSRAQRLLHACASCVPLSENPAFYLGTCLGVLGRQGRDKITFIVDEPIKTFDLWLEQLLAESTGKEGRGLLPIANEPLGKPNAYGADRLFVHLSIENHHHEKTQQAIQALQEAGHPVIRIELLDPLDLGQEFMRWEIAVAVAGSVLGLNVFDQPNVQESKDNTQRLLQTVSETGNLPHESLVLSDGTLRLYTQLEVVQQAKTLAEALEHWLYMGYPGYYIALMAYLKESEETEDALQAIRTHLRDSQHLATTLGYGPRFLHSTGQYHKGGPNTGLFLQLTAQDKIHIPIPGRSYDFSTFKQAEALGDLQSLQRHGRRAIRIDLGADPVKGLQHLQQVLNQVVFSRI